jgi:tRNA (adenine37-N6)-methyltransferase
MSEIIYKPIGLIHSPYKGLRNLPVQPSGAVGIKGFIEIFPEYESGLADLDGFSHVVVIYHMHLVKSFSLKVIPFIDNEERGIFATRAPVRPNPIGLTVVKLIGIRKNILEIENIDIVDLTPVIDIKPYFNLVEKDQPVRIGWMTGKTDRLKTKKTDTRFL